MPDLNEPQESNDGCAFTVFFILLILGWIWLYDKSDKQYWHIRDLQQRIAVMEQREAK